MRVQVKTKQDKEWLRLSVQSSDILILVDVEGKAQAQRPDFYILNFDDWKTVVTEPQVRLPKIRVDEQYRITYPLPND